MLTTTEQRNGGVDLLQRPAAEQETREDVGRQLVRTEVLPAPRVEPPAERGVYAEIEGRLHRVAPELPPLSAEEQAAGERGTLAVFCYEDPEGDVGRFMSQLTAAVARRDLAVHVFTRRPFAADSPGLRQHVLGDCAGADLLDRVQEFTRRACNAFLKLFPAGHANLTLLGHEWSAVPALSLLRGIRNASTLLSLHSLERQRSDLGNDLSKRIAEIELSGLREARTLLFHDAATAEAARLWLPECVGRGVQVRQPFPVPQFQTQLDAGAVKARYQVGPVDPLILFVGDLDERYGPDVLVKAMPAVLRNNKQARLVVVGDGALLWPLRVYARYLLLEHAVRVVGSVEGQALRELIAAAEVVVMPSREQTPWWPILAAWAAGKPVAVTHNAAPGLVEHEKDAVLFYPNENSCVWGVERVLFDAALTKTMTRAGTAKLEERFGWNSTAVQLEELMGVAQAK
jgi:glycosyltransferase involved in cell wall biosynthesis